MKPLDSLLMTAACCRTQKRSSCNKNAKVTSSATAAVRRQYDAARPTVHGFCRPCCSCRRRGTKHRKTTTIDCSKSTATSYLLLLLYMYSTHNIIDEPAYAGHENQHVGYSSVEKKKKCVRRAVPALCEGTFLMKRHRT